MASSIHNNRGSPTCLCCKTFNMWCLRAFQWLPVLLIVAIITWSYYAYAIQLCIFTIENTVQQILYLVLYHIILIMFCWAYWRTIFADIRLVPEKYKLPQSEVEKLLQADSEEAQRSILENYASNLPIVTRTMSGSVRYCNRCVLVKPDRAHHCSICSRCVLKMDHHCPWVNNCVCFHNYKFFMLFLGYALLYCIFIMATSMPYFIMFWKGDFANTNSGAGRYHIVFAFCVALMFGISLGSLFSYHCYLVAKNRTTLDMLIEYRSRRSNRGKIANNVLERMVHEAFRAPMFRGGPDKNGFSLGAYNNFKEVFGVHANLWLLPVFTSLGDGSEYPVRREHQLQLFTSVHEHQTGPGYESMGTTRSRSDAVSPTDPLVHSAHVP